jgi:hypothetical protein
MVPVYRLRSILCIMAVLGSFGIISGGCGSSSGNNGDLQVSPSVQQIAPGGQTSYTVSVQNRQIANSTITVRVTGVPTNATATFSPSTIPANGSTSTLSVQVPNGVPEGSYTLRIFVQEAGQLEREIDALLVVSTAGSNADFLLEVQPDTYDFGGIGGTKTFNVTVRPLNNFTGNVNLSLSLSGDDINITQGIAPTSVAVGPTSTGTATFTLTTNLTPPITSPVFGTVSATSGGMSHQRTITLSLPQQL